MITFPHAKINLGLHVLRKRDDGFHDIESCLYPVGLRDILEVIVNDRGETLFESSGITIPGDPKENLCLKAYELVAEDYPMKTVNIHLHKQIPVGAGLGGGSSNGVSMLQLLNNVFDLSIPPERLMKYAVELGSDCPFFLSNSPSLVSGKGNQVEETEIDLSTYTIALVFPDIHIVTAEAYALVRNWSNRKSLKEILLLPVEKWKDHLHNDFEDVIFNTYPELAIIKQHLYDAGAVYASMSGSGSTLFSLFRKIPEDLSEISFQYPHTFISGQF